MPEIAATLKWQKIPTVGLFSLFYIFFGVYQYSSIKE
jgi:hypothetical protein